MCVVAQTFSLCLIRQKLKVCATERRTAKLTLMVWFLTAPTCPMEYASDNRFRERLGAVTNRTYRTWRITKLTLMVFRISYPTNPDSYLYRLEAFVVAQFIAPLIFL